MTNSFDDLIKQAKTSEDNKANTEADKARTERETRAAFVKAGIDNIERYVNPLVQDAVSALLRAGVHADVKREFDVENRAAVVWPSIIVKCGSPPRSGDGWVNYADELHVKASPKSFVLEIVARMGGKKSNNGGACAPDQIEALFKKSFEEIVASYYEMIRQDAPWIR